MPTSPYPGAPEEVANITTTAYAGAPLDTTPPPPVSTAPPAQYKLPEQTGDVTIPDEPLPYMATDRTDTGELVYSQTPSTKSSMWDVSGFKEWARQAWANIFNPTMLSEGFDAEETATAKRLEVSIDRTLEQSLGWDKWIKPLTGIESEEAAKGLAALKAENDLGDKAAQITGQLKESGEEVIRAGLNVLGALDKMNRVQAGVSISIDELLQDEGVVKERDGVDPRSLVWQAATPMGWMKTAEQISGIVTGLITGKVTLDEVGQAAIRGVASSNAIYALAYDNMDREEYYRRYEAGENPSLLAKEFSAKHPWVELAGSIVLDPSTYFGMGAVKYVGEAADGARYMKFMGKELKFLGKNWETAFRIPEFGEMVNLKRFGKARLTSELADFDMIPELKDSIDLWKTGKSDEHSLELLKNTVTKARDWLANSASDYRVVSYSADAKANILVRDSMHVVNSLLTMQVSVGEKMEYIRAMVKMADGTDKSIAEAMSVFARAPLPGVFLSEKGMQTAQVLKRLADSDELAKVLKSGASYAELEAAVLRMADEIYPSVDEMVEAKKGLDAARKAVTSAKTAAEVTSAENKLAKAERLAKAYDNLKATQPSVLYINSIAKRYEKLVLNWQRSYMGKVFISWMPSGSIRNISGNTSQLAMRVGTLKALEISSNAAMSAAHGAEVFAEVLAGKTDELEKVFGNVPPRALAAISDSSSLKGIGMAQYNNRVESMTRANIMLHAGKEWLTSAMKAGGIPSTSSLVEAGLDKTTASVLRSALERAWGNVDEAIKFVGESIGSGVVEKWRHTRPALALDQMLKYIEDGSDEFDDILKTSQSAAEFADRADAYLSRISQIAEAGIRAEPPGVDKNLPDVIKNVLTDMGEYGDESAPVFEKMVQANANVRTAATAMINSLLVEAGNELQSKERQALGAVVSDIMAEYEKSHPLYTKIREATLDFVRRVKGEKDPAKLWNELRIPGKDGKDLYSIAEIFPNVNPNRLSTEELVDKAWKAYFAKASDLWSQASLAIPTKAKAAITDALAPLGMTINDVVKKTPQAGKLVRANQRAVELAEQWNKFGYLEMAKRRGIFEPLKIANAYGIATASEKGVPTGQLLSILKKGGMEVADVAEITPDKADEFYRILDEYAAGKKIGNAKPTKINQAAEDAYAAAAKADAASMAAEAGPYSYLQEHGVTISEKEFSDIFGGKIGVDKQGVPPGLFSKTGSAIDDVGLSLMEGGFITAEQAADTNYIREFLRKSMGQSRTVRASQYEKALLQEIEMAKRGPLPPHVPGPVPSKARVLFESMDEFSASFKAHVDNIITDWGNTEPVRGNIAPEIRAKLEPLLDVTRSRMSHARNQAEIYAQKLSDFVLHDYNKTYLDLAGAYLVPFHYWSTRTYMRGIENLMEMPQIGSTYAKFRQFQSELHADQPEWYRYNIQIGGLPGMDKGNVLMFNLESLLNPYNSMTGVDFTDPYKRVDWLTRTVDNMSKNGYTPMPLVNWALAAKLMTQGEDEASQRWLGRLLPQSQTVKALAYETGVNIPGIKNNEIDPFVQFFMGGLDPYERRRVGRAAASLVDEGMDGATALDAVEYQDTPEWEQMVQRAIDERAPWQVASFFFGVGVKARTPGDMRVEEFYGEYFKLLSVRENMAPDDYRVAWDKLREKYPFADTVLLSKRSGDDRDAAFAYNVLGRIPPGMADDLMSELGVPSELINKFYDSKGDTSGWERGDRLAFMSGIANISAIFAMPKGAVREEWTAARNMYGDMKEAIGLTENGQPTELGRLYSSWMESDIARKKELETLHPELGQMMSAQTAYIVNNPLLSTYYGGIETIERYYDAQYRTAMITKYGKDIFALQAEYYDIAKRVFDPKKLKAEQKKYMAEHPAFAAFYKDASRKQWDVYVNRSVAEMAARLPEKKLPELRDTQGVISGELQGGLNAPERGVTPQEIASQMSPELQQIVSLYAQGQEMPYAARTQLERLANSYQLTLDELIQLLLQQ